MAIFITLIIIAGIAMVVFKKIQNKSSASSSLQSRTQIHLPTNATLNNRFQPSFSQSQTITHDNDFGTFDMRRATPQSTKNSSATVWIQPNTLISVQGRQITAGLVYYSTAMPKNTFHNEPSLIYRDLPVVGQTNFNNRFLRVYTDESLGYYPSYADLSPQCRGVYLDWLTSDRNFVNMPIGYVFIYFAGLEHRIITNLDNQQVSDDEFAVIYEEVERLLSVYQANHSFRNYASNFLTLLQFSRPQLFSIDDSESDNANAEAFRLELAKTVQNHQPIPALLALSWLKYSDQYTLKTPARRCESQFRQLFSLKYQQQYGSGLQVSENKTRLKLTYRPASRLLQSVHINVGDLPDPSVLTAPIKKLAQIADTCTELLNPLSRYLAKEGNQSSYLSALLLLPDELINPAQQRILQSFQQWAKLMLNMQEGLIWVSDFWSHLQLPIPNTLSKKDLELMTAIANKSGFAIAPDPKLHQIKPKADGYVVLYQPLPNFTQPSTVFNQVTLMLRLGAMVAVSDEEVSEQEVQVVVSLIEQQDRLSDNEKASLRAYLLWQLNTPTSTQGLKAQLALLKPDALNLVKKYILRIALADDKIENQEIKQLEKLYTQLGFDKAQVMSDIHQLQASRGLDSALSVTSPVTVGQTSQTLINQQILDQHEQETKHAQALLAQIFTTDEPPQSDEDLTENVTIPSHPNATQSHNNTVSALTGLEPNYQRIFEQLTAKEKWDYAEFTELCKPFNIMPDAAIEMINDWAYDKVDAPVLDAEEMIYVDFDIVEELQA